MLEEKMILKKSLKMHKPDEFFKCSNCDYECVKSTALKNHITKKHKAEQRTGTLLPAHPSFAISAVVN